MVNCKWDLLEKKTLFIVLLISEKLFFLLFGIRLFFLCFTLIYWLLPVSPAELLRQLAIWCLPSCILQQTVYQEGLKKPACVHRLDFRYWSWHIKQRTQHVLFKGKLHSSIYFDCVNKPVVKDAIYLVFQKPLLKFLTKVTENPSHLLKLSHATSSRHPEATTGNSLRWFCRLTCKRRKWGIDLQIKYFLPNATICGILPGFAERRVVRAVFR